MLSTITTDTRVLINITKLYSIDYIIKTVPVHSVFLREAKTVLYISPPPPPYLLWRLED